MWLIILILLCPYNSDWLGSSKVWCKFELSTPDFLRTNKPKWLKLTLKSFKHPLMCGATCSVKVSLCHFFYAIYCIRQNFCWPKFSPKAHTLYWDKNFAKFKFANHVSYLPGNCGWNSRITMRICVCVRMCQIFLCAKKFMKKFLPMACIGKIGENFLLAKISVYMVILYGQKYWVKEACRLAIMLFWWTFTT